LVQPKFALLENVAGILQPFRVKGQEIYAWFEVAQAFAEVKKNPAKRLLQDHGGYIPICLHVNAKYAGVAQNRPRFIMLNIRRDVFRALKTELRDADLQIFEMCERFFMKIRSGEEVRLDDLPVIYTDKNRERFKGSILSSLINYGPPSVKQAIDDLKLSGGRKSAYVRKLNDLLGSRLQSHPLRNHDYRTHKLKTKRRFRIYQVLSYVSKETGIAALEILNRKKINLDERSWRELSKYHFYIEENKPLRRLKTLAQMELFLIEHQTGKHTQKALIANEPAPAALSIPDDACHYRERIDCLRTLTVREMARIQSFPDNFVFRSKNTTGGERRKFEVPQYTQVGNAVPPLLGRSLGIIVQRLLRLEDRALKAAESREQLRTVA
jgi:DNA (cytosine-5)-methyltransferase 1